MRRIEFFLKNRAGEELEIGVILFSTEDGILGKSENADELLKKIQENRRNKLENFMESEWDREIPNL